MNFLKRLFAIFVLSPLILVAGDFDLGLKAQYRFEQFNWKATDLPLLNNLNQAQWENIRVPELKGFIILRPFDDYLGNPWLSTTYIAIEGGGIVGTIQNPLNATYFENSPDIIFTHNGRPNFNTNGDDFSVSGGFELFWYSNFSFNIEAGYSNQHRRFHGSPGELNTLSGAAIDSLELIHLNYRARWEGPWFGIRTINESLCPWIFNSALEYHCTTIHGKGHWQANESVGGNLLVFDTQISQKGTFHGVKGVACVEYAFSSMLRLGCNVEYEYFWKSHGSGSSSQSETTFNAAGDLTGQDFFYNDASYEIRWKALAVSFIADFIF